MHVIYCSCSFEGKLVCVSLGVGPQANQMYLNSKHFGDQACFSHELSSDSADVEVGGTKDFKDFCCHSETFKS